MIVRSSRLQRLIPLVLLSTGWWLGVMPLIWHTSWIFRLPLMALGVGLSLSAYREGIRWQMHRLELEDTGLVLYSAGPGWLGPWHPRRRPLPQPLDLTVDYHADHEGWLFSGSRWLIRHLLGIGHVTVGTGKNNSILIRNVRGAKEKAAILTRANVTVTVITPPARSHLKAVNE